MHCRPKIIGLFPFTFHRNCPCQAASYRLKSPNSPMAKSTSSSERRLLVDKYLTELSLLAKQLCPEARVEATTEGFEEEDGHVRIYPPTDMTEKEVEEIEREIADRCVDIVVGEGVLICSAVYD